MFGTVFRMNPTYIIPAAFCCVFFVFFFNYSKQSIVAIKQLSLKLKSPVFSQLREMMRGIIPIQTYGQVKRFTNNFIDSLNISLEGSICFIIIERAFGVFVYYVTVLILLAGMELGAIGINSTNSILYGVQILYIFRLSQVIQLFLRQLIIMEGLMISAERTSLISSLPPENQLYTQYDKEQGIS